MALDGPVYPPMGLILDSVRYPFRGENRGYLAVGAALFCIPPMVYSILPSLPYVGLIGLILEGFILGYMLIFFRSVMETATRGEERLDWPDVTDAQSMAGEVFQMFIPLVISFLPLIGLGVYWTLSGAFKGKEGALTPGMVAAGAGLALLGVGYLPMALLAYSFYGETAVVKFWAIGAAIARVAADYFKAVALLLALFAVHAGVGVIAIRWPAWIFVPTLSAVLYYTMVAGMRAVGLIYHRNRERLGWER